MDFREITEKVRNGLTYDAFMVDWTEKNALPMKGLDKAARRMRYYSIYNLERQGRVDEMYVMRDEFRDLVLSLPGPQLWMFITEDWCVDSAYSLPIVRDAAALRADITLRLLMRDENLDLIDQFLTNGARSVPVFAGFSSDHDLLFRWGPQPVAIRDIRAELQASRAEGRIVAKTTVDWYADEGWIEVERELIDTFKKTLRLQEI